MSANYPNEPTGFTQLADCGFSSATEDGWYDDSAPSFAKTSDASAPKSPSDVLYAFYPAGWASGGGPVAQCKDLYTAHRYLYISLWVRLSPNFHGEQTRTNKIAYIWIHNNPTTFLSCEGADADDLFILPRLQNCPDARDHLPRNAGNPNDDRVTRNAWHRVEMLLYANTPGTANGIWKLWFDGVLTHDYSDVAFCDVAQSTDWEIIALRPIWGGNTADTVPADQWMYIDHYFASAGDSAGAGPTPAVQASYARFPIQKLRESVGRVTPV